jgi:hypothetical protein
MGRRRGEGQERDPAPAGDPEQRLLRGAVQASHQDGGARTAGPGDVANPGGPGEIHLDAGPQQLGGAAGLLGGEDRATPRG